MDFIVLTIFPEMFAPFWEHGIIKRAIDQNKIFAAAVNIRDYAKGRHRVTDDRPYGGGSGMVMKPEPLAAAIRAATSKAPSSRTILLTPQGRCFNQIVAHELASSQGLVLVCGRYEGVDERICHEFIDDEISIGDYVLTGGELAAMVIIDAVTRLIPGVLGGEDSAEKDSFSGDVLEHPHYTRPRVFEGAEVPEVLLSGHHKEIEKWRLEASLIRTFLKRKDLLENRLLSRVEIEILKTWCRDIEKIISDQSLHSPDALSGAQQER
ncbi:MAG: tRNA (guanosine(37)-N1)-methyltransferase TrmD [Desulfobacterales bacterium]|uniref:tRNA (guanine-N(1)-)-methyltransferase n=1 Tax=Candidatus Desulfatibia profunda TaxID=2841695 RepID=A0A8J6NQH9_9BACT|nr:tRNA (guanosine(37)-N1)-methyltransferase TrmD [Candidatus Desulfatibia profunda]MBL7180868.1 tRNA (guanosine(37)-N1)-methyltransferase TrmD [Desulfobacterales bacterium]